MPNIKSAKKRVKVISTKTLQNRMLKGKLRAALKAVDAAVAAGTADAAVIDLLMAGAMIGEGTNYANLTYTVNLNTAQGLESEEYGVGFRKGSDLADAWNSFWAAAVADGSVLETGTAYGVQESLILE